MESMKDSTCKSLWWDHCYEWACILVVDGFLRDNGNQVSILNIYAPCSSAEKAILWDLIHNIILQLGNIYVAVVGDFNAIRVENERVGRGLSTDHRDIASFDNFIQQSNLFDLPLSGRWPNYTLKSCGRTFSDHCPIYLESAIKDWGAKPFRFINSWITHPDFKMFIKRRWEEYKISGWTDFRLKDKLKLLKADLKSWNKLVFVSHNNPAPHLLQHCDMLGVSGNKKIASTIWTVIAWTIWKGINERIFNGKQFHTHIAFMEIKAKVWSWFVVKNKLVDNLSFSDWDANPRLSYRVSDVR
ncbi:hypothetical protein ACS0TY_013881 [Phlomoides rotata]